MTPGVGERELDVTMSERKKREKYDFNLKPNLIIITRVFKFTTLH